MEHYNMLFVEKDVPGLKIIRTEAYQGLLQQNPGLLHENFGDFYSPVPVDGLSDAIYRALDKEFRGKKLNQDLEIVDYLTFNPAQAEMGKDYLVREVDGIRVYMPRLPILSCFEYNLFGLLFVGHLFSDKLQGSLQVSLKEIEEKFS